MVGSVVPPVLDELLVVVGEMDDVIVEVGDGPKDLLPIEVDIMIWLDIDVILTEGVMLMLMLVMTMEEMLGIIELVMNMDVELTDVDGTGVEELLLACASDPEMAAQITRRRTAANMVLDVLRRVVVAESDQSKS